MSTFEYYAIPFNCDLAQLAAGNCPNTVRMDAEGQQNQQFTFEFDVVREQQQKNEIAKYNNSGGEVYVSN